MGHLRADSDGSRIEANQFRSGAWHRPAVIEAGKTRAFHSIAFDRASACVASARAEGAGVYGLH